MRVVFQELPNLSESEQQEAANSFLLIGRTLRIGKEIERRMRDERSIDVMENQALGPAIRKGLEQGRPEGRQEGRQEGMTYALQAFLKGRFGLLPPWALTKITEAPFATQDRWLQTDPAGSTLEESLR